MFGWTGKYKYKNKKAYAETRFSYMVIMGIRLLYLKSVAQSSPKTRKKSDYIFDCCKPKSLVVGNNGG